MPPLPAPRSPHSCCSLFASRVEAVGIVDQADPRAIQYRVEGGPLRELAARFKPNELAVMEKLNRPI